MDTQIFDKVEKPSDSSDSQNVPSLSAVNSDDAPVGSDDGDDGKKGGKGKKGRKGRKDKSEKKSGEGKKRKDGASWFVTNLYDWTSAFLFALILVVMIMTFCFRLVDVDGDSMLQTLQNGNKIIVTGLNYEPQVGDIVVIAHGAELDKALVKRVIAVGGQTVDINSETGDVIVDGIVIKEDYINGKTTKIGNTEFPLEVEDGTVFVLGDNRPISKDSRFTDVGLIDNDAIIGKVQFRIYPFNKFGRVDGESN
ncbi:MAG: signal peptidase I [Clostridia bacterium]|nr:signal peptidase I [Clostridia bacterium]